MLRLTLDTSAVIHGAQAQRYAPEVDQLVDLGQQGRVGLWITSAFAVDQETASADKRRLNRQWLSRQPLIGSIPGPFRLDYSPLGGPDVLADDQHKAADAALRDILLPGGAAAVDRRKVSDVQHLAAHLLAGHDLFVTSDHRDILRRQAEIRARTGIVVVDPVEAVQLAHGHAALTRP
jgi:hypothetical protein